MTSGSKPVASLKEAAKRILILYAPWPTWRISNGFILGNPDAPDTATATASDEDGMEIISHVPSAVVQYFLSTAGQTHVNVSNVVPLCLLIT